MYEKVRLADGEIIDVYYDIDNLLKDYDSVTFWSYGRVIPTHSPAFSKKIIVYLGKPDSIKTGFNGVADHSQIEPGFYILKVTVRNSASDGYILKSIHAQFRIG